MQLHDFLNDPVLNDLRAKMGTDKLGQFELFDPAKQLTYSEREALAEQGIAIQSNEVRVLKDKTLAYKNSRVWLKFAEYHLAHCHKIQQVRHHPQQVLLGTYVWPLHKEHQVCLECLALLQYQGVDARRLRRTEFSEQIGEQFSLAEFAKEYPFYPLV